MKKYFLGLLFSLFAITTFSQTRNFRLVKSPTENPTNQQRKAVVIGMSDYGEGRALNNTLNDANDMAEVLTQLGFEVTLLKNNDLRNLEINLTNWYNNIEGNDMAIFYFAGHGMEVNGENYLIPVDAQLTSETDVKYNALNVNQVLGNMDERKVSMKLLILDACRNNPFKRSWNRGSEEKGLAQMAAPQGTYIAFAASPGFTAQDGENYDLKNGVFTYYLKEEILKEGVTIDQIFNNVTGDVATLTHRQQTPFKNSSLSKDFYFKPKAQIIEPTKKYYYYVTQNGKKSTKNFDRQDDAENEMKQNKLYGKIYSNAGEVFVVDAPEVIAHDNHNTVITDKVEIQQKLSDANECMTRSEYDSAFTIYQSINEQNLNAKAMYNLGLIYFSFGKNKNDAQAIHYFKMAANQGNTDALIEMSRVYYFGDKNIKDCAKAKNILIKLGNAKALYTLGSFFENGKVEALDYVQAKNWYQKAADKGSADAMLGLARVYVGHQGISKDITKVNYWCEKALNTHPADDHIMFEIVSIYEYDLKNDEQLKNVCEKAAGKGNRYAMNELGDLYYLGKGNVKEDYSQAKYWFEKAANKESEYAMQKLGDIYKRGGNGMVKDFNRSKYWFEKAANAGSSESMAGLGDLYRDSLNDGIQAKYWYEKAIDAGYKSAIFSMGYLYQQGCNGIEKDYSMAKYWYQKDADEEKESGSVAMECLAKLYKEGGYGITKDYALAKYWFEKAVTSNDKENNDINIFSSYEIGNECLEIGKLYQEGGNGLTQDYSQAKYWFEKAADKKNSEAMAWIGYLYEYGQGVTLDYIQAKNWYQKSADAGNDWSMKKLANWAH